MLIHELWSVHINWLYDQVNSFNWFSVFFISFYDLHAVVLVVLSANFKMLECDLSVIYQVC